MKATFRVYLSITFWEVRLLGKVTRIWRAEAIPKRCFWWPNAQDETKIFGQEII